MTLQTNIIVRLQVEGLHNFPLAGELFSEVAFLSYPHRHLFHITCKKEVFHDDRDVEFILFKRKIESYLILKYGYGTGQYCDFKAMSCEMIARELLEEFELEYCSVFEDNENGAEIFKK